MRSLETRDVVRNMLLQAALAFCWMWALFKDHMTLVWLLAAIENKCEGYKVRVETSIPPAFRKGEGTMPWLEAMNPNVA
ncbi:dimethylaniline monooxygenase [Colletotrichum tofieldiae]|nr:dimethylaniline monooxygenase [Colletotrichum tofieldiae]